MTEEKKKMLVVVWHWSNVHNNHIKPYSDTLKVDQSDSVLLRYDTEKIEEIKPYLDENVREHLTTYDCIVCLHANHGFSPGAINHLFSSENEIWKHVPFIFFKGKDTIYISDDSPMGLLGYNGAMHGNAKGEPTYAFFEQDGEMVIKKDHFQSVWNYYFFKIKQNIFELKEGFTRAVLGKDGPDGPLPDEISFHHYQYVLNSFTNNIKVTDTGIEVYEGESRGSRMLLAENEIVTAFKSFLDQSKQLLSSSDLPTKQAIAGMNDAFCKLLNTLPEKTYAS